MLAGRRGRRGVRQRLGGDDLQGEAREAGVIFCSISEAVQRAPGAGQKYLGSVVPYTDNFYAALNSAVFSDGSFVYIPKGTRCPMELSTYFRINAGNTGQFERTLIVADEGSYVSYLEGCTAPMRDENQLHAAVVELVALEGAEIKYSTVQNWYPGDENGGRHLQLRHQARRLSRAQNSKISWTQVETGSAITWKYPSCILQGRQLGRRVLLGGADQQPPAGRHRHQDDPHRQEHRSAPSSPRASPPGAAEHLPRSGAHEPVARRTRATTRSATRC
jgi:Fe-S cluster assembly scaffold protein SufB